MIVGSGKMEILMAESGTLRLTDKPEEVILGLEEWHSALLDQADKLGDRKWWLPEHGIGIRLERRKDSLNVLGADLTVDRAAFDAAVEINPGATAGSGHVQSGIAMRGSERWLVRQGRLQAKGGKTTKAKRVDEARFAALSALLPVSVEVSVPDTPTNRSWYVVCPLHMGMAAVRSETAEFVRRVAWVRAQESADVAQHPDCAAALAISGGEPEPLQHFYLGREDGLARRLEEEVVQALERRLWSQGVQTRRPVGVKGYKADLEVIKKSILIEAKASVLPGYVQQGVGQLFLYPHLIKRVMGHKQVLLVPEGMELELSQAVLQNNIRIATFRWAGGTAGTGAVEFEPQLLELCTGS